MIPTVEEILSMLSSGECNVVQAMAWMEEHFAAATEQAVAQAGQELTAAPSQEGHAAGPAPAAPDVTELIAQLRDMSFTLEKEGSGSWAMNCGYAATLLAKLGQGWIPVSERLPTEAKDQIMCLVSCAATEDDSAGVSVASYDEDEREWNHRLDTGCWTPGEVTHWMPLPPLPGASDD